jgi:hypothetical protein
VRDVLVGSNHDHAAPVSVDSSQVKNVGAVFQVGTEDLFVIAKSVASLRRHKERRRGVDLELAMGLLEDGPDVDNGIYIGPFGRVFSDRRRAGLAEKLA